MTMIATQIVDHSGFVGNPPITVLTRTDVAKTPAMRSGHGRSTMAWKNPVIRKMKNRYSRTASSDAIASRPTKYTIIRAGCALRGRGARVYPRNTHTAARATRPAVTRRSPAVSVDQARLRTEATARVT